MKNKNWLISAVLAPLILAACTVQPIATASAALPTLEGSNSSPNAALAASSSTAESQVSYADLYEQVNPGVVAIIVYLEDATSGQGSGFVIDNDGHILTNYHVVEGAVQIEIVFPSGYRAEGRVIGKDLDSDIAVVQVDVPADELHPLSLGSSTNVKVGQQVVAIGNPYGLSGTMTLGIVSARGRLLDSMREAPSGGYFTAADLIQTDAAINPGNSGGPLLNLNGEVIGINRAIRTNGEDGVSTLSNSGIGFAVPIDVVKRVTPYLIENGSYDYPYLGIVSREELTLSEREYLGLSSDAQGAYVISVVKGGPADRGGMIGATQDSTYTTLPKGGDLITAVDDQPVRAFSDLLSYLVAHKSPGDSMRVTVLRDGSQVELNVVLTKRPD
jgi:S1-C subfamily serine protease